MSTVLITGMSGVGKSTLISELAGRGHQAVDTDEGGYVREVEDRGQVDHVWDVRRIAGLLDAPRDGHLFVSGCVSNQGRFADRFDAVVLVSVPAAVLLERVATRTTNPFGKDPGERERILDDLAQVEPLLRAVASLELDGTRPVVELADTVLRLADDVMPTR